MNSPSNPGACLAAFLALGICPARGADPAPPSPSPAPALSQPSSLSLEDQEREVDRQHLRAIYAAIQAYRAKTGNLPDYLSTLVPDYLSDTNVLMSPVELRTGRSQLWGYGDPKIRSSYIYEFNAASAGGDRDRSKPMTMREWKSKQMEEFGPVIPILRCHLHEPILNVAYSGDLFETALFWETDPATLALIARLGPGPGAKDANTLLVTVLDRAGKPLEGAEVQASNRRSELGALPPRTTKSDAKGQCRVNLGGEKPESVTIRASMADYAPASGAWADGAIPAEWTGRMFKAVTVGGLVKSEAGTPVAGAKVQVNGVRQDEVGQFLAVELDSVTTDSAGVWVSQSVPAEFERLSFRITHSEYMPTDYDLATPDNATGNVSSREHLLARKAEMIVPPGIYLTGVLKDKSGRPVAGAQVVAVSGENLDKKQRTVADPSGGFRFVRYAEEQVHVVAQAKGMSPFHRVLELERGLEPLAITLEPGTTLKGTVLDEKDKPVAGATVRVQSWQGLPLLDWHARTDEKGGFAFDSAPAGPLAVAVSMAGYDDVAQEVSASSTDPVFRLAKTFLLRGKAVDAETKAPIPSFKLVLGTVWDMGAEEQVNWEGSSGQPGRDGSYELRLDYRRGGRVKLMAIADGYLPVSSPAFDETGWHAFDFELKKGKGPEGVVQTKDGKPVEGAQVALLGMGYLSLGRGEFKRYGGTDAFLARTDAQGRFSLPAALPNPTLAVVHEKGYAEITAEALKAASKIPIEPWGRIEGVMRLGNKIATNEMIMMAPRAYAPGGLNYDWETFRTTTDENGRFTFTHVPPGPRQIVRLIQTSSRSWSHSHIFRLDVKAGETTAVTYGGTGRAVIGRVVLSDGERKIDWNQGHHSLSTRWPQPPRSLRNREEMLAWNNSPEAKAARENSRHYSPRFSPDGSFRIEDVPAGTYDLRFNFTEPEPGSGPPGMGQPIGSLSREVVVPEMAGGRSDEPLDMGELTLTLKGSVRTGVAAPEFETKTLDGKPLKLSDYRGKFVLLDFWAAWCGPCVVEVPHLKAAYDAFGKDERFVMISLSLDPKLEDAEAFVKKHGIQWAQGFLGEWSKTQVPASYGVEGIPSVFLIGPDGKIAASNLRGPSIRVAVGQALEKK